MSHMDDFLDLYPNEGPDAGTGPLTRSRCATPGCGDRLSDHSWAGPCNVIKPTMLMRADGVATREERTYCECRGWKKS